MIATRDLTFSYYGSDLLSFPNVSCSPGDQLLILGDSGSGKTTLLHLICGLLKAQSGSIKIGGVEVSGLGDREMDKFRGANIGVVFQQAHFVQSLSVRENLALPSLMTKDNISSEELNSRISELLNRLGLSHKANSSPKELSVGEQQRASIARALIHKPKVVFADEPTSALDDTSTEAVISLLEEETKLAGACLVIVTHDQRLKSRYVKRVELKN
mgnify:CR=1 FL=1